MMRAIPRFLAIVLAVSLIAAACGEDTSEEVVETTTTTTQPLPTQEEPEPSGTIVDVAVASGAFPTLIAAVQAAGLVDTLNSDGPFTVFAPTEEAFATALANLDVTAEELLANTELLTAVLTYHVLATEAPAELVVTLDGQSVTTVNGADITITIDGDTVKVNNATVVATDIQATNGIIHVIDTVLLPPTEEEPEPPPAEEEPEAPEAEEEPEVSETEEASEPSGTIVDVAVASGAFPTLIAAVQAAGLVDTLNSDGPFTVFAPTEEAFATALANLNMTAADLLANTDLLTSVLTYHVLLGEAPSEVVATLDGQSIATVNGADVTITVDGDTVRVNDATVVTVDIQATNGIIHIIDTVLLPPAQEEPEAAETEEEPGPSGTIVDVAVASGAFPTLIAAVQAAGLVDTLNSDGPFTVFAPTEEAFATALANLDVTAEELLANTELLTAVLTYHVLATEAPAELVVTLDGQSVTTVNGADITITIDGDTVKVNNATVVATDIQATNGIIHVIDTVLLPPSEG
ncbi:MAG: fasciclin domain-containing protein [bacterium]|nr:fasciclin domain-containing protein [bacterium]